jgi:peptidoglycan hydrolase CwlO-like protein
VRPDQRNRGRRVSLALAAVAALGFALLPAGPASADSLDQAKAAAHQAALDIQRLQPQLQAAIKAYETALSRLASGVTNGVSADEAADQAQAQADAAELVQGQRIRALYMSGGSSALLASLLSSGDPQQLLERLGTIQRVMASDNANTQMAVAAATLARSVATESLAGADALGETAGSVQADLDRVEGLMAAAQARLNSLSAQAKQLQDARDAAAALAQAQRDLSAAGSSAGRGATGHGIPPDFLVLYRAAATTCPGLDWHVLAAIGQVESGHGRNNGPSASGAEGPMQFLPGTFAAYAVDGNHDGVMDIWNPADAIFTAAHYLCANGAGNPHKLYTAIWHYNHADWYVQLVLGVAASLTAKYPG